MQRPRIPITLLITAVNNERTEGSIIQMWPYHWTIKTQKLAVNCRIRSYVRVCVCVCRVVQLPVSRSGLSSILTAPCSITVPSPDNSQHYTTKTPQYVAFKLMIPTIASCLSRILYTAVICFEICF